MLWKGLTGCILFSFFIGIQAPSAQIHRSLTASHIELDFEVDTLFYLNSERSDICPSIRGDELFFASDREYDLLNWNMDYWGGRGYYSLYRIDLADAFRTDVYRELERLPRKINAQDHSGPIAFSADSNTAYFSRVSWRWGASNENGPPKPQLFSTRYMNGDWGEVEQLPFIEKEAYHSHPSVLGDDEGLFFTSDRGSGQEDADIFFVERSEDEWGEPKALPASINSSAKEAFPYYRDSTLFFSSDREGGHGGLDIYASVMKANGEWGEVTHFGPPLNSSGDDLGLVLGDSAKEGFFSSDRIGGKGKDDIYRVHVIHRVTSKEGISGHFEYRKLEGEKPSGMVVELVDDEGKVIMRTKTDEEGEFYFEELPPEKDVTLRVKDKDADVELVMEGDREGVFLMKGEEGRFVYRKLEGQQVSTKELKELTDPTGDPTIPDVSGQFVYERLPSKKAGKRIVEVVNEEGEVVMTRETDEHGNFQFEELPPDKEYKLRLKEVPEEDLTLHIYDRNGKVVAQLKSGDDGVFDYRKLGGDKAGRRSISKEEPELNERPSEAVFGKFEYKELDADVPGDMRVRVINDEGEVQFASQTDSASFFRLVNAAIADSMRLDVITSSELKGEMVIKIMDRYGNVIGTLHKNTEGYFMYRRLEGDEAQALSKSAKDEAELNFPDKKEKEKSKDDGSEPKPDEKPEEGSRIMIHFERNSSFLENAEKEKILTALPRLKGQRIRILGHASARGTPDYNQWLSERRAERIRDFLVEWEIDPDRIQIKWFGEERPLNDCDDAKDCGDEGHSKNRRVEIVPY